MQGSTLFSSSPARRAGRGLSSFALVAAAALGAVTTRVAAAQRAGAPGQPPATPAAASGHAGHAGMDMSAHAGRDTSAQGAGAMGAMHGKAPHGGQVAMAGSRHLELHATAAGELHVWMYDAAMKPVAVPAGGSVVLTSGSNTVTLPLTADAAGRMLTARFDAATYGTADAEVRLPMAGGQQRTARFKLAAAS